MEKKKQNFRNAPRVINLLCTSGNDISSTAILPDCPLADTVMRGPPSPQTEPPPTEGRQSPLLWPRAPLTVPKTRQMCTLKINTARKETSHRVNQYPAKDNGIPVQAAVSCPLPLAPVSPSSQGQTVANSPHSSVLRMVISPSDAEAPHAAK